MAPPDRGTARSIDGSSARIRTCRHGCVGYGNGTAVTTTENGRYIGAPVGTRRPFMDTMQRALCVLRDSTRHCRTPGAASGNPLATVWLEISMRFTESAWKRRVSHPELLTYPSC
jgi:hypothetical protein